MSHPANSIKNWIPFRLKKESHDLLCQWLYLGTNHFTHPFFDETISQCLSLPENSSRYKIFSDPDLMNNWAGGLHTVKPTAIIFHVSRCGSTLLSQLLAQNPENIALSEVPFFDDLLRLGFRNRKMNTVLPLLKAAVSLYGVKRNEEQKRLFIKTDSWHIFFYKEWRALYPDIPFFFLYRQPDEVLRSHQQQRGMHAVQGVIEPALFGFDETVFQIMPDEYLGKVLEAYYLSFADILKKDKLAFAYNYKDGMLHIFQQMMDSCAIHISEQQKVILQKRCAMHGKYPGNVFNETAVTEPTPACLQHAVNAYNKLEEARLGNW